MQNRTDIFISYSREDRAKARMVAQCLEREGFNVWWDAALHSGESFDMVIERHLEEARAVVVLWSPRSVASRWVRAEASMADRAGKLAPVIIEPCTRPIIFELLHTFDLCDWAGDPSHPVWTQFLLDLHRAVQNGGDQPEAGSVPPAPQPEFRPAAPERDGPIFVSFDKTPAVTPAVSSPEDEQFEATQFSVAPRASASPIHLLELMEGERAVSQYPVGKEGRTIGRAAPADIVLGDRHVSRSHCRVEPREDQLVVIDLGSTNGTFVDDEKVNGEAVLALGSQLVVGSCRFVYRSTVTVGS